MTAADLAVIGAGPAGCAAAIALCRAGRRVLLLERAAVAQESVCGEFLGPDAAAVAGHPVREFMTPQPQTLVADAKIAFAVERMDTGAYRHLPIVDDSGQLVGIISARDILRHLTDALAREAEL